MITHYIKYFDKTHSFSMEVGLPFRLVTGDIISADLLEARNLILHNGLHPRGDDKISYEKILAGVLKKGIDDSFRVVRTIITEAEITAWIEIFRAPIYEKLHD